MTEIQRVVVRVFCVKACGWSSVVQLRVGQQPVEVISQVTLVGDRCPCCRAYTDAVESR